MLVRDIRTGELVAVTSVHELALSAMSLMQSDEVRVMYAKMLAEHNAKLAAARAQKRR